MKKHSIEIKVTPIQYALLRQIARERKLTTAKALELVMHMGFTGEMFIKEHKAKSK